MKKIKIFLCCFLAIVISAAACSCASFTPGSSTSDELIGALDIEASNTEFVTLSSTVYASDDDTVTYELTATVKPAEAYNKACNWTVGWKDNPATGVVSDYIELTQDGSNVCYLTCKKAFAGSTIEVIVSTVEGGYTASCIVSYVGIPTKALVHDRQNGSLHVIDESTVFDLDRENSVSVALSSPFGYSTSAFNFDVSIKSIVGGGTVTCCERVSDDDGNVTYRTDVPYVLNVTTNGYLGMFPLIADRSSHTISDTLRSESGINYLNVSFDIPSVAYLSSVGFKNGTEYYYMSGLENVYFDVVLTVTVEASDYAGEMEFDTSFRFYLDASDVAEVPVESVELSDSSLVI